VTDDDRLHRYLTDRAEGLTLAPGNADAVMRRANRRRLRRRGVVLVSALAIGTIGTTALLRHGDDSQQLHSLGSSTATPSTYHWSTVQPGHGLAFSGSQAQLPDGSVYGLSTAPGAAAPAAYNQPSSLYRTTDGTEWSQATLPAGFWANDLEANGDTLYAVGTTPAGGSTKDLVVATSSDHAASWSSVTLPSDLRDLQARHPHQVSISQPVLAAKDAAHQVVSVVARANLDFTQYKPEYKDQNVGWEWTDTGVTVRKLPAPTCDVSGETDPSAVKDCRTEAAAAKQANVDDPGQVVATYTWQDLGIDPELQGLVNGRSYTYVTDDGTHFAPTSDGTSTSGSTTGLLADSGGYTMFVGHDGTRGSTGTTDVLHSTDGHAWSAAGQLPGYVIRSGALAGRPAVALGDDHGDTSVRLQQADGSWLPLDLTGALPAIPGAHAYIGDVAFGPLGLAATASAFQDKGTGPSGQWVLHTTDGSHLSIVSIPDVVQDPGTPVGLTVTADAIAVRLNAPSPDAGKPGHIPTQTVLVGTPAG
jgi:hypothetical protein